MFQCNSVVVGTSKETAGSIKMCKGEKEKAKAQETMQKRQTRKDAKAYNSAKPPSEPEKEEETEEGSEQEEIVTLGRSGIIDRTLHHGQSQLR